MVGVIATVVTGETIVVSVSGLAAGWADAGATTGAAVGVGGCVWTAVGVKVGTAVRTWGGVAVGSGPAAPKRLLQPLNKSRLMIATLRFVNA